MEWETKPLSNKSVMGNFARQEEIDKYKYTPIWRFTKFHGTTI